MKQAASVLLRIFREGVMNMMINNPFQISDIAPDLPRQFNQSLNVIYKATTTCYLNMYAIPGWSGTAKIEISTDDAMTKNRIVPVLTGGTYYDNENEHGAGICIIKKGDYYRCNGVGIQYFKVIPCKGDKTV